MVLIILLTSCRSASRRPRTSANRPSRHRKMLISPSPPEHRLRLGMSSGWPPGSAVAEPPRPRGAQAALPGEEPEGPGVAPGSAGQPAALREGPSLQSPPPGHGPQDLSPTRSPSQQRGGGPGSADGLRSPRCRGGASSRQVWTCSSTASERSVRSMHLQKKHRMSVMAPEALRTRLIGEPAADTDRARISSPGRGGARPPTPASPVRPGPAGSGVPRTLSRGGARGPGPPPAPLVP